MSGYKSSQAKSPTLIESVFEIASCGHLLHGEAFGERGNLGETEFREPFTVEHKFRTVDVDDLANLLFVIAEIFADLFRREHRALVELV